MKYKNKLINLIAYLMIIGFSSNASSTLWEIDAVLAGAGLDGTRSSGFHGASDGAPMSGGGLGIIMADTGLFGTWDDVTGIFDATFSVTGAGGSSFDANGNLLFSGTNLAACAGADPTCLGGLGAFWLTVDFAGSDLFSATSNGNIFFQPGNVCCDPVAGPNSLVSDGSGGLIMNLWGANGFNGTNYSGGGDTDLGLDLRLHLTLADPVLSRVPEPASILLLGFGLIVFGLRRLTLSA